MPEPAPNPNPHFRPVGSWEEAAELIGFPPRCPSLGGIGQPSLTIHVRDHRHRDLAMGARTFEAHYPGFVLSQARRNSDEAARLALQVQYGQDPRSTEIAGHEGHAYALGPEVPADDVDGRTPAVVSWYEGDVHYLLASVTLSVEHLEEIAASLYR